MIIRVNGVHRRGRAIDLQDLDLEPRELVTAIRDPDDERFICPTPGDLHREVGWIRPSMGIDLRTGLVAAARSHGLQPPQQDEIRRLNRRIGDISTDVPDLRQVRSRVAEATADLEGRRERVARLSGQVSAEQKTGEPDSDTREALNSAIRELTEAETEAIAARQALETAEREARAARDRRETRLSLVDRRDNLKRGARAWLASKMRPGFERALKALPTTEIAAGASPQERPVTAALGLVRIAHRPAPVVLDIEIFDQGRRASAALDAPVVLV